MHVYLDGKKTIVYTIDEVAKMMEVTPSAVYQWLATKKITGIKNLGPKGGRCISEFELQRFCNTNEKYRNLLGIRAVQNGQDFLTATEEVINASGRREQRELYTDIEFIQDELKTLASMLDEVKARVLRVV